MMPSRKPVSVERAPWRQIGDLGAIGVADRCEAARVDGLPTRAAIRHVERTEVSERLARPADRGKIAIRDASAWQEDHGADDHLGRA